MKNKVIAVIGVFFLILLGTVALRADDELQPGVARVSLLHGDVSTQRGDSGDWVAATVNTPIVAGDWLLTATKSRTELQLDYANVLRLSEETEAKIADLSRTKIQIQVRKGLINFDVFKGTEADVEIDTPNMSVRPVGEGQYRVLVVSDEETQVIVRKGEADVTTPQGSTTVKKGEFITIRGRDNPEYKVADAPDKDAWDNWNKERDSALADARSYERTNRYYTGVSDLDGHGNWVYIADYGWVWSPSAGPGWAPYRYGRWVWEPYWGWTWVSYEPWGWAPYHYGRWFLYSGSWCWWPGPVYPYYRPIWAPAYVSFFGWGHHGGFGVGIGFGNIGWLPIGPRDYYYPWWGRYRRNVNVVNITNITNIRNVTNVNGAIGPLHHGPGAASNLDHVLTDPRLRRGMTAMPGSEFGRAAVPRTGRPVVTAADLRQGQLVAGNVPVVPTRESLRAVDRPVNRQPLAQDANSDKFFTRTQPTYHPQPFHTEAGEVRDAIHQRQAGPSGPDARPGVRTSDSNRQADTPRGRETQPGTTGTERDTAGPQNGSQGNDRSGWSRFGDRPRAPGSRTYDKTPSGRGDEGQTRRQSQSSEDRAQPRSESTPGFRKFDPQTAPRTRDNTPRDTTPSGRGGASDSTGRMPRRDSAPDSTGPQRPPARESDGGFRPFTPQPERERTPRGDSVGGDRPSSDRGSSVDRGPSRAPESDRGSSGGRQPSADRQRPSGSDRPPLEFRRPIMEPRAPAAREGGSHAPAARDGGSRAPSSPRPPSGNQGSGGGRGPGKSSGGGRQR